MAITTVTLPPPIAGISNGGAFNPKSSFNRTGAQDIGTFQNGMTNASNVVFGSGATVTLTPQQSGSIVLFDRAAGIIYTLPPAQRGLYYQFVITTSITSNNAKVITANATTFLIGSVFNAVAAGTGTEFIGNGSTHVAVTQNGTTSGGLVGTIFSLYCVTPTIWCVDGTILGSGTIITPFATS